MPRIGILGGSGLETLLEASKTTSLETPYGPAPPILIGSMGSEEVAFLPRHGVKHDLPPHKVNYRANLYALRQVGVERIIATNAVGGINSNYKPGDLSVPQDIVDMTKSRINTFYESSPVTHIDVSEPYCPELRKILLDASRSARTKVWGESVLAATEGPRYETPAEIRMLEKFDCDIVGMTGAPETFLARELEMCYAAVCFISNRAAGKQSRLSAVEVMEIGKKIMPQMIAIIRTAVANVPKARTCRCANATHEARV